MCSVYVSRLLVDCSLLVFSFQMTSSGAPFWSGPKRCPHPIEFDADNVSGFMSASASSVAAIFCACPFLCHQQSNFLCLPFPMSSAEQFSVPALSYVISRAIFCACPFLCPSTSVCFLARFQLLLPVGEDAMRKNHVCCLKNNKKRNERGKKRKKKKIHRERETGKKSCKRVDKGSVNVIPE